MSPAVGLAFNPVLASFVAQRGSELDFLEISPERFWFDRGPAWGLDPGRYAENPAAIAQLEAVRGDLPLVAHGVGLSLATAGPLDQGHLEQLARWRRRYSFPWFSEHLAYFRLGPEAGWRGIGVMLPPTYDEAVLEDLELKAERVRDVLGVPFLLENAVNYTPVPDPELSDAEFLLALSRRSSAGLLLDLHNLHTDAVNRGLDPFALIDALDLSRVQEIHLAGGEAWGERWIDSHSGLCPPEVWALLDHVLGRESAVRAITLEIDESHATRVTADEISGELARVRSLRDTNRARRSPDAPRARPQLDLGREA